MTRIFRRIFHKGENTMLSNRNVLGIGILLLFFTFARDPASAQSPDPKVIEGAKKEGQMVFYTTMTLDQSKEVVDRFQKKYPFIKPTLFRTGASGGK